MPNKIVNGIKKEMSATEVAQAQENLDNLNILRNRLIAMERAKIIEALLAPQKQVIEQMNEEEVIVAIRTGGLP